MFVRHTGATGAGVFLVLLCRVTLVLCQIDGDFPFVGVSDEAIQTPNDTTKVFTTTVFVRTTSSYTNQLFLQAATSFYNGTFRGFQSVGNLVANDQNSTQARLTYDVTYNYVKLRSDVGNDSQAILTKIGRIQAVKPGLEANDGSNSFSVDLSTFVFTGDSICDKVECQQGTFTHCDETPFSVDVICRSSCKVNFCRNEGWCHHHNGSVQPVCSCRTSAIEWYIGRHCETYIHIWIPIVVLVLVVLCLVIIIVAGVYFYKHVKVRTFKPKPEKTQHQIKQQKVFTTNGNYPKQTDPLKDANATALRQFKSAHEDQKKMNGSRGGRDGKIPKPATPPSPPQTEPPPESVVSSQISGRRNQSSSSSSRGDTPAKDDGHYEDISSSTSTDSDVTDGTDSHHYSSADLPGGFDWRAPIPASPNQSAAEEGIPKYSVPNKAPKKTQDPITFV